MKNVDQIVNSILQKSAADIVDDVVSSTLLSEAVVDFLRENPNPTDADLHKWAEENNYNIHEVETEIYKLATSFVQGLKEINKEAETEPEANPDLKGFVTNIEEDTVDNDDFRRVLYTGKNSQLVLMSIEPGDDIGVEVHTVDQFFRVDSGSAQVIINDVPHDVEDGFAFVVPATAKHNVINIGDEPLKLYSIYSPPQHKDGTVHSTKDEAMQAEEHFDGETSE